MTTRTEGGAATGTAGGPDHAHGDTRDRAHGDTRDRAHVHADGHRAHGDTRDHVHVHADGHRTDHTHVHGPTHDHGPLESYDHVQGGAPVLDIGGDIGALVVTTEVWAAGTELHLRSEHEPPIAVHTGVWNRRLGDGTVPAAVFMELVEGTYAVLDASGDVERKVTVKGGELAQIDLRSLPS